MRRIVGKEQNFIYLLAIRKNSQFVTTDRVKMTDHSRIQITQKLLSFTQFSVYADQPKT